MKDSAKFDKWQWLAVARVFNPALTWKEFQADWREFQALKLAHIRQKAAG